VRTLVSFAAALILWSAVAWFFLFHNGASAHVCSILQTSAAVGDAAPPPLTEAEQVEDVNERCGPRPGLATILIVGTGYVVIVGAFVVRATRPSA